VLDDSLAPRRSNLARAAPPALINLFPEAIANKVSIDELIQQVPNRHRLSKEFGCLKLSTVHFLLFQSGFRCQLRPGRVVASGTQLLESRSVHHLVFLFKLPQRIIENLLAHGRFQYRIEATVIDGGGNLDPIQ
jgi:hypothetical protein